MSYILDALRKSDLQRQRSAAPTLLAVHAAAAPKRPAYLAYGLLAAVLVGAGIVIGWLRPWQTEQAAPRKPVPVAIKPLEQTPLESTQREAAPAPAEMTPQPKLQSKPQAKRELTARAKPQADGPAREADAAAPSRSAAPERPVDPAADAAGEQTVISMAELPPSVRQELPAISITVHAYSDNPAARLVGIDNRILREGDSVVPGLKLEQITPDGMIFGYKGYRFHRGVK